MRSLLALGAPGRDPLLHGPESEPANPRAALVTGTASKGGVMPAPLVEHKDPRWWERLRPARRVDSTDICIACGHTRDLHNWRSCKATSASMVGSPGPCRCAGVVKEYRDAGTLIDVMPRRA